MAARRGVRDSGLLDRLDAITRHSRVARAWRVVREGRDSTVCGTPGGRWDDGTFDVLYTSETADGAIAEMYFHLSAAQPIFPSQVRYQLFELSLNLHSCIAFSSLDALADVGMDVSQYGQLSHADRKSEYPRSQEIGEHAFFLGADSLVVPNARWDCSNIVLFCDHLEPGDISVISDHGVIDWDRWQRQATRKG
jgi:hypothetical protein